MSPKFNLSFLKEGTYLEIITLILSWSVLSLILIGILIFNFKLLRWKGKMFTCERRKTLHMLINSKKKEKVNAIDIKMCLNELKCRGKPIGDK